MASIRRPLPPPLLSLSLVVAIVLLVAGGCAQGPSVVSPAARKPIDRSLVDYPGGVVLKEVVRNLTAPCDFEEDAEGNWIIAESGMGGYDPRIFMVKKDGSISTIYPSSSKYKIPDVAPFSLVDTRFHIYGPIGGICVENGKIYVTHRDAGGNGVVTAFGYDSSHTTIAAALPAQGDNGMSDIVMGPDGRLHFGVGSPTNSGVVGLDNWHWVKFHPEVCDKSYFDLKLNGYHFKSKNPDSGLFGAPEIAVTAPFQPFNVSSQTRIRRNSTPTGAIYSADPNGGALSVDAHGIRCPRGLAYSEFGNLFMTNQGMELRGTRPIADDPDAMVKVTKGTWYGFPDYSADLNPITDDRYQPQGKAKQLLIASGYPEVSNLIDHNASNNNQGTIAPLHNLLQATFQPLSGAGRFDFVPDHGPLAEYRGSAIVPLSGDRSPFATSGQKLVEPQGFRIVRVDPTTHEVTDFIRNTKGKPSSLLPEDQGLLERPVAVKFGRDGSMYIVDLGRLDTKSDRFKVHAHTGRIFKLEAQTGGTTTKPTTTAK